MKILIVDDHMLIREGLKKVLKQLEADVEIFESPSAARTFEIAQANTDLDLIVLDLMLADACGLDTLQTLRRNYTDIPVVILSASTEPRNAVRCIKNGAVGFIPKSTTTAVLLGAVRLVLSGGIYLPPEVLLAPSGSDDEDAEAPHPDATATARTEIDAAALGLTDRQAQVLALLIQGKTNKEIGRALDLAEQTVKAHISGVLRALNVTNRAQAIVAVAQLGSRLNL